ncbi:hypothetical protein [Blastomonas sp.]|uniref:hypothetical protein n=1 Tax=Blastomonas sp. TaxID=1909299 RepID=UPI003593A323
MIALLRERTQAAIPSSFRGDTPRNRLIALMKDVRKQLQNGIAIEKVKPTIQSNWSVTKDQLLKETHGKCAYCETSMVAVAFGDVEHYRPKSVYWWLAYVYDNYLASCAICNQRFKGAQFERGSDGIALPPPGLSSDISDVDLADLALTAIPDPLDGSAVTAFAEAHRAEKPLIPNPYFDNPEDYFEWEVMEAIGEVWVTARHGVASAPAILNACERIYGINRPDLRRRRCQRYVFYKVFKANVAALPDGHPVRVQTEELIATLIKPNSEYAAMIRYLEGGVGLP